MVVTDARAHWESTYAKKTPEEVSWHEPVPQRSLELIEAANVAKGASALDVGGGASRLAGAASQDGLHGGRSCGHLARRARARPG
jgi:hypothetical protein